MLKKTLEIFCSFGLKQTVFLLAVAAFTVVFTTGCGMPVEEYRQKKTKEINDALQSPDHTFRQHVESAHKTVKVKKAYVSSMSITTKDGKSRISDESDIERIEMQISAQWDGVFHKNGETVLQVTYENSGGELKVSQAKIVKTDALINIKDPQFWLKAAASVVTLLVL